MAYDNPQREIYVQPSSAFGATTEIQTLIGPKGKKGKVVDIDIDITADMVGTTTVPEINVGTASGDATYARWRLGSAAGTGYAASATPKRATQEGITGNPPPTKSDFAGHVELEKAFIPADTAFVITRKQGVGGTPAGTARSRVIIEWF